MYKVKHLCHQSRHECTISFDAKKEKKKWKNWNWHSFVSKQSLDRLNVSHWFVSELENEYSRGDFTCCPLLFVLMSFTFILWSYNLVWFWAIIVWLLVQHTFFFFFKSVAPIGPIWSVYAPVTYHNLVI